MIELKKHTICHVVHTLDVGGAEILAKQFAYHGAERFNMVFACLDRLGSMGESLVAEGFTVQVIGRSPGFDWRAARRLSHFFKQHRVSVVHAHQYAPFFYSSLARGFSSELSILFTEHGRSFPDLRRWKRVLANRFLISRRDRIVAVGEQVRQALIANEGFSPQRVHVVYNGVPVDDFASNPDARAIARRELGIESDTFLIVQVARLNALKDHVTAVETMGQLVQVHPQVRLMLVGEGETRSAIESAIASLNLQSAVTLVGVQSDVSKYLYAGDAFLLSSVSEGIPLTLIEAMAAGLPCVVTAVGGIPEVIEHEKTGLLAPAKCAKKLADNLSLLISNENLRRELAGAGNRRARSEFSDEVMHAKYQELYLEMAGAKT